MLTLNNAAITQGYLYDSSNSYSAGIYANGALSIVLKGSSSIAAPENGNTFFDGICEYVVKLYGVFRVLRCFSRVFAQIQQK